jgi:hypothetical protein
VTAGHGGRSSLWSIFVADRHGRVSGVMPVKVSLARTPAR